MTRTWLAVLAGARLFIVAAMADAADPQVIEIRARQDCWITIPYSEVVRIQAKREDSGINSGWWGFQFWTTPFDARIRPLLRDAELTTDGDHVYWRLRFSELPTAVRIAAAPPGMRLSRTLEEFRKMSSEILAAIAPAEGEDRKVVQETLEHHLSGLAVELDLEVVESWHRHYPIPAPEVFPLENNPAGGVEFFRGSHHAPIVADYYFSLRDKEFGRNRAQLTAQHLQRVLDLRQRRGRGEAVAEDSVLGVSQFLGDISKSIAAKTDAPVSITALDARLVALRDALRDSRIQLRTKTDHQDFAAVAAEVRLGSQTRAISLGRGQTVEVSFVDGNIKSASKDYQTNYPKGDGSGR